eukprot:Nk52_evm5s2485 gene=Nk52_evmTU5s2485
MTQFRDVLTGDVLFSDARNRVHLVNDIIYEIDCVELLVSDELDDIEGDNGNRRVAGEVNNESLVMDRFHDLDSKSNNRNKKLELNIVREFEMKEVSFDKMNYEHYLKAYLKALREYLEEKEKANPTGNKALADTFMRNIQPVVRRILGHFKSYRFFTGASSLAPSTPHPSGMVLLLNYRPDGLTPYFTAFKDGLHCTMENEG